jgi:hypothetical protein
MSKLVLALPAAATDPAALHIDVRCVPLVTMLKANRLKLFTGLLALASTTVACISEPTPDGSERRSSESPPAETGDAKLDMQTSAAVGRRNRLQDGILVVPGARADSGGCGAVSTDYYWWGYDLWTSQCNSDGTGVLCLTQELWFGLPDGVYSNVCQDVVCTCSAPPV